MEVNLLRLVEVKMDNTKQVVCILDYRPASFAGFTSCAKRITPYLTSFYNFRKLICLLVSILPD